MIILTFIIFSLCLYLSNKKQKTKNSEIDNKNYSLVFVIFLGISIICDLLLVKIIDNMFIIYCIISFAEMIVFLILNTKREKFIQEKHKTMQQIITCLGPVLDLPKNEEIDLEGDYGFETETDKNGYINLIKCEIRDPNRWTDDIITRIVFNLNKYLEKKRWVSQVDYPNLECKFVGTKLPPKMAKYPGSWLRPWNLIPLGVDGENEISINLGANKKELGESAFFYEPEGKGDKKIRAKTIVPPKAPQILVCGSTGGGKAIYVNETVEIL